MDFYDVLERVLGLLQRHKRVTIGRCSGNLTLMRRILRI